MHSTANLPEIDIGAVNFVHTLYCVMMTDSLSLFSFHTSGAENIVRQHEGESSQVTWSGQSQV